MANQNLIVDTTQDPGLSYLAKNAYNNAVIITNQTGSGNPPVSGNNVVIQEIQNITQVTLNQSVSQIPKPGGSPGQVQLNINQGLTGDTGLTYDLANKTLESIKANIDTLIVSYSSNLGIVGNVIITGGNANSILVTNGSGNLSWVNPVTSFVSPAIANLPNVARSGSYADLTNKPTIPTTFETLSDAAITNPIQPNQTLIYDGMFWKNEFVAATNVTGLATVATSGSYSDLANKPTQIYDTSGNTFIIANDVNATITVNSASTMSPVSFVFGNDGKLHLPPGGDIVDIAGTSVLGSGNGGNGGNGVGTSLSFAYGGGVYQGQIDPSTWDTYVTSQHNINFQVGGRNIFSFSTDGKMQLPLSGDIVDSNGTSVLNHYGNSNVATYLSSYGGTITANVEGANVLGAVANATFATSAGTAATVTTSAQPNITSVGTLDNLTITNTLTVGNIVGAGQTTTASNTAPTSPTVGDTWYDTVNDVTYRYIYDGTNTVWMDFTGPAYALTSDIPCVREIINAGFGITMDSITVQLPTGGNRSIQLKVASGTITADWTGSGVFYTGSTTQSTYDSNRGQTFTTSYSYISTVWNFLRDGDRAEYMLRDTTNNKFYRITLQLGTNYTNNLIMIERLAP